ncbi:MAG: flagellar biosynthesis protein FlhA [Spirochaetaceae bacterium]|jgi:hypothetical protein|nr:flagellar biosynthesis protein FlhA [Spirochaetaceae bacterium]
MNFIGDNISTIVVGAVVFAILLTIVVRQVIKIRKGKSGCGCCDCAGKSCSSDSCNE